MQSKLCYICSPYRGDIERNTEYARELTRIALDCGYTPITPHLYLTQVLNEEDQEQREKGMAAGTELLRNCRYIFIGSRYGLSEGMLAEIQIALEEYEKIKSKYGISEEELKEPQQDQQEKQFDGDTLFQAATTATMLKAEQEECDACPGHYGQAECKECGTYGNIQRLSRRLERLSRKRKGGKNVL